MNTTKLTPETIHAALVNAGAVKQLPEAYKNDLLVHDLAQLAETGTQAFIWVLRTNGTHIFELDVFHAKTYNWTDHILETFKTTFSDNVRVFYCFENGKLTEVTYDEAVIVAKRYAEEYRNTPAYAAAKRQGKYSFR